MKESIRNTENYSLEELIEQIEDRFECIFGEIYMMSPGSAPKHNLIVQQVSHIIDNYFRQKKLKCYTFASEIDVYLNYENKAGSENMEGKGSNYVEPDLFVLCDPSKMKSNGVYGVPDLIMEVISPSTKKKDYNEKLKLYRESGVKEYWILDYDADLVTIYNFPEVSLERGSFDSEIESKLFPGLKINFGEIKNLILSTPYFY